MSRFENSDDGGSAGLAASPDDRNPANGVPMPTEGSECVLEPLARFSECKVCREKLEYLPIEIFGTIIEGIKPTFCEKCWGTHIATEEATMRKQRCASEWLVVCPPCYRDTDPARLTGIPSAKLQRVLDFDGKKGLIVHGPTRKGKTRMVWLLIKRLLAEGATVSAFTSGEFARKTAEAYSEGGSSPREWFKSVTSSDYLFIDDLGKCKLTERVESELFDVVEHVTSRSGKLLVTCNAVGDELASRMSTDRGPAIVSRLREFCESVSFQ